MAAELVNVGLGFMGDSITVLKNAAQYLEERGSYGTEVG